MTMEKCIVNPEIEEYLHKITPERDAVLREMEALGDELDFPIVGPLVGRLLYTLTKCLGARRILELGSGFGYSAYWFSMALPASGRVVCTESEKANADLAISFFKKAGIEDKIEYHIGDALKEIDEIEGEFGIIFNDINKHQYPEAFRKAVPRLRKGGLFISDNVLWSGRVLDEKPDASTAAIIEFTRLLYSSNKLFTTIIPVRDGVSVSIKL